MGLYNRKSITTTVLSLAAVALTNIHAGAVESVAATKLIGERVPSVISCTKHQDSPIKDPKFKTNLQFFVAEWRINGERVTNKYPGQETFEGVVNPDGSVSLKGNGRWERRDGHISSWRYVFKGRLPNEGSTAIKGQMFQINAMKGGKEHLVRDCTLTFILDSTELRRRLGSSGRPRPSVATATTANDIADLKRGQADAAQQRQRDQEKLAGVQSGQTELKSNLDATSTRVGDIEAGLILPVDERPSDWTPRIATIPVQQQQFCQIINRYNDQLIEAQNARNKIAQMTSYRERRRDFLALLPNGQFENWVMRVKQVDEVGGGNAAVVLQLPCRVKLGNSLCRGGDDKIGAILPGTVQYRELERAKAGDFVVVSGRLPYVGKNDDAEANASPAGQTSKPIQPICVDKQGHDTFATDIGYVARMN